MNADTLSFTGTSQKTETINSVVKSSTDSVNTTLTNTNINLTSTSINSLSAVTNRMYGQQQLIAGSGQTNTLQAQGTHIQTQ